MTPSKLNINLLRGRVGKEHFEGSEFPEIGQAVDGLVVDWAEDLKASVFAVRVVPVYSPPKKHALHWLYSNWGFWAHEVSRFNDTVMLRTFPQKELRRTGFPVERFPTFHLYGAEELKRVISASPIEIFWFLDAVQFQKRNDSAVLESGIFINEDGNTWTAKVVGSEKSLDGFEERLLKHYRPDKVTKLPLTKEGFAEAYKDYDTILGQWKELLL